MEPLSQAMNALAAQGKYSIEMLDQVAMLLNYPVVNRYRVRVKEVLDLSEKIDKALADKESIVVLWNMYRNIEALMKALKAERDDLMKHEVITRLAGRWKDIPYRQAQFEELLVMVLT